MRDSCTSDEISLAKILPHWLYPTLLTRNLFRKPIQTPGSTCTYPSLVFRSITWSRSTSTLKFSLSLTFYKVIGFLCACLFVLRSLYLSISFTDRPFLWKSDFVFFLVFFFARLYLYILSLYPSFCCETLFQLGRAVHIFLPLPSTFQFLTWSHLIIRIYSAVLSV